MTSRVIIGPDGKYVPQPELTPGVYSPGQVAPCECGIVYCGPLDPRVQSQVEEIFRERTEPVIYEPPAPPAGIRVLWVFWMLSSMGAFVVGVWVGRAT